MENESSIIYVEKTKHVGRNLKMYVPDELTNTIHQVMINTNQEHLKLTEWSIVYAPEYLITVNLTKEIKKLCDVDNVYMEWNIKDLISSDNIKNIENIRDGKCDICILMNDNTNILIEVKNTITNNGSKLKSIHKDIERIGKFILNNNDSFNIGYVCFLVKANGKEKVKEKSETYFSEMNTIFPNLELFRYIEVFKEEDEDNCNYIASVVVKIQADT